MSIAIQQQLDPTAECILYLERAYAHLKDEPASVEEIRRSLSEKYSIPPQILEDLFAPVQELETDLLDSLRSHEALLEPFFFPESVRENRLAWAFYFLEQENADLRSPDRKLRQRLISLMLNCDNSAIDSVEGLDSLLAFLDPFSCSEQLKWLCIQVWRQPSHYYDLFCRLKELTAPVIDRHQKALLPLMEGAMAFASEQLNNNASSLWELLGMPAASHENLIVLPTVGSFNGMGVSWDHTDACGTVHLFIGVCQHQIAELVHRYSDNSEFLAGRLKTLSDQRRLEILKALKHTPMYGQELADLLNLSPATISHHMGQLVADGLVNVDKQGVRISYSLHRSNIDAFLQNLRATLL